MVDIKRVEPLLEDGGLYRDFPVFPFDAERRFEMLYIEIDPGGHLEAEPHPAGTQEFITAFSGELSVSVNGETFAITRGSSLLMVQLTVRIPDELHTKIKVIGVYENTSINNMVVEALQNKADEWEKKHGKLPVPEDFM